MDHTWILFYWVLNISHSGHSRKDAHLFGTRHKIWLDSNFMSRRQSSLSTTSLPRHNPHSSSFTKMFLDWRNFKESFLNLKEFDVFQVGWEALKVIFWSELLKRCFDPKIYWSYSLLITIASSLIFLSHISNTRLSFTSIYLSPKEYEFHMNRVIFRAY